MLRLKDFMLDTPVLNVKKQPALASPGKCSALQLPRLEFLTVFSSKRLALSATQGPLVRRLAQTISHASGHFRREPETREKATMAIRKICLFTIDNKAERSSSCRPFCKREIGQPSGGLFESTPGF